ncbi:MAG: hypothetical protein ABFR19_05410 [Pseudomonadota bacterium]
MLVESNKIHPLLLLLFVITLTACVPDSKNPLTGFDRDAIDASLYGSWFWKDDDETGYLHFGREGESGMLQLMMVELNSNGKISVTQLLGHTSQLGENRYLNLKFVPPEDGISEYIILKYEISDKGLGLAFMDPSVVEKAIEDKVLAGSLKRDGPFSSVHLSDMPEKLQLFVSRHDKEVFPEMKFLPRLYN